MILLSKVIWMQRPSAAQSTPTACVGHREPSACSFEYCCHANDSIDIGAVLVTSDFLLHKCSNQSHFWMSPYLWNAGGIHFVVFMFSTSQNVSVSKEADFFSDTIKNQQESKED